MQNLTIASVRWENINFYPNNNIKVKWGICPQTQVAKEGVYRWFVPIQKVIYYYILYPVFNVWCRWFFEMCLTIRLI